LNNPQLCCGVRRRSLILFIHVNLITIIFKKF
jgi:hypothetical protein